MTRDEILNGMKDLILDLRDNKEVLQKDKERQSQWKERMEEVTVACNNLNSCDALWLTDEYGKWHKEHIKPYADSLPKF